MTPASQVIEVLVAFHQLSRGARRRENRPSDSTILATSRPGPALSTGHDLIAAPKGPLYNPHDRSAGE